MYNNQKSWAIQGLTHMFYCSNRYIISAAKVFHVGASENVVIQAYGYTDAFAATVSMKSFPDKRFTYSSANVNLSPENKFQNSASLTIQPRDLSGRGNPVSHVYLEVVSPHFTKEKKIPLNYENGFLFIQTDKPVYTPDQTVKIRVYSLNEELKPARRETTLTFIDPEGEEVEILQENDYFGIVSFPDFKIPSNPNFSTLKFSRFASSFLLGQFPATSFQRFLTVGEGVARLPPQLLQVLLAGDHFGPHNSEEAEPQEHQTALAPQVLEKAQ
ncbi:complement C5-like [Gracilinanus agilis]|uniref:complement C5-like n=1 Tax=Gracilinanus agilis TaxID=191870 RepID=UPI001CFCBA8A|nr:complement C5-like [Gracilinanus agilis]